MVNDLVNNNKAVEEAVNNIELNPVFVEEDPDLDEYTKLPLSRIPALGVALEPLAAAAQSLFGKGAASGIYKVSIPPGTHLESFNDGRGLLGAVFDSNNKLQGQAVLDPIAFNPTLVFAAMALAHIEKRLDEIVELQKEMLDFVKKKEKAELRGNIIFLSEILNNYKYNWNNETYKNSNHIKVLDLKQNAEQKVLFYRDLIVSTIKKKKFLHTANDAKEYRDKIYDLFQEYQLALYLFSFSSFMDVLMLGNYEKEYLNAIRDKLDEYSIKYRELYTKCYAKIKEYLEDSVQNVLLKGLKKAGREAAEAISKTPILKDGPIDETLMKGSEKVEEYSEKITTQEALKLADKQSGCVSPFVDNIEKLEQIYNKPLTMMIDQDAVYLKAGE